MGSRGNAEAYIEEAFVDLDGANTLIDNEQYKVSVFHIQQCVEKALKALAYYSSNCVSSTLNYTHDIDVLLDFVQNNIGNDKTLIPDMLYDYSDVLNEWEVLGRYPGAGLKIWKPAQQDIDDIIEIMSFVPEWLDEIQYVIDRM